MAANHDLRRELSRRIRDDLIHLGMVDAGPAVRIADGTEASIGDLIVCTKNDHSVQAGEPGRSLANGDLLRIEAITPDGVLVRRALDADPRTGQRRWTDRNFLYADYGECELGYAVTDHVAQSRTVHAGLAVITGTEDRQHAYVALTRGTDTNIAYVFTLSPKIADPAPGPRPAPELARYDRLTVERSGEPADEGQTDGTGDALGVLSDVLERDGQQLSALQTSSRPCRTLTTWRSCTPSGRPRPAPRASRDTRSCSWTRSRRDTGRSRAIRPDGYGAPCAPPNSSAWTPVKQWPTPSASGP